MKRKFMLSIFFFWVMFGFLGETEIFSQALDDYLICVFLKESGDWSKLNQLNLRIYAKQGDCVIAGIEKQRFFLLDTESLAYKIIDEEPWTNPYYLITIHSPEDLREVAKWGKILFSRKEYVLVKTTEDEAMEISKLGFELARIFPKPLPLVQMRREGFRPCGYDSVIAEIVSHVSQDSITAYIQRLQDFKTRYCYTESCEAAGQYIYDKFTSWGIPTEFDEFEYQGKIRKNVVATLTGTVNPDQIYIICGHFDSISEDPWHNAPGADDDGSGTATVMEAARVLKDYVLESTVKFITFWGEEIGLVGSYHYASEAYANGMDIRGVFCFDMVAYREDPSYRFYIFPLNSEGLADLWISACEWYTSLIPLKTSTGAGYSDFYYFMVYGYPATRCRDNHYASDNPYFHTSGDRIETLNLAYATEVVKGGVATLAQLALGYPILFSYRCRLMVEVPDDGQ